MSQTTITPRQWETEPERMPTIGALDELVFSEHGRVIYRQDGGGTDYRSHWLCVVKERFGGFVLLVKHAAGEERIQLGFDYRMQPLVDAMQAMDSDTRYLFMSEWLNLDHDARYATDAKWRKDVASGRVVRKRVRGHGWQAVEHEAKGD